MLEYGTFVTFTDKETGFEEEMGEVVGIYELSEDGRGLSYIVELDATYPNEKYPYSAIVVPESAVKKYEAEEIDLCDSESEQEGCCIGAGEYDKDEQPDEKLGDENEDSMDDIFCGNEDDGEDVEDAEELDDAEEYEDIFEDEDGEDENISAL